MASALKDPNLTSSFIASNEGFKSTAYPDYNSKGVFTGYAIGYGNHYNADGSPVQPGQSITQTDGQALMQQQIVDTYAPGIANRIGEPAWSNLTPEQQAAYVDLSYNYGSGSRCLSDSVAAAQTGDPNAISSSMSQLSSNPERRARDAALANGQVPGNVKGGGPSAALPANAKGAGAGSGAGCAGAGLGMFAALAGGGLLGGLGAAINGALGGLTGALGLTGLTGALGGALSAATGALGGLTGGFTNALSSITGGVSTALNTLSGGAFGALSGIGSSILPSLTGVLPSGISGLVGGALNGVTGGLMSPLNGILQNPLNLPNAMQQFASYGGIGGMINRVAGNMMGNAVSGSLSNFMANVGITSAYSGISNNVVGAIGEASAMSFGTAQAGGLGNLFRNNNDIMSYGTTTLSLNLPSAASDLSNLGTFATTNMLRLQQPSHVAAQILNAGLGDVTGLTKNLVSAGIPIAGVDNPLHDVACQRILTNTTGEAATGAVSAAFNIGVPLQHLGQLTDIKHMCPNLSKTGPSQNFAQLGQHFLSLGLTRATHFQEIGTALSKIDSGLDLNHLTQLSKPFYQPAADRMMQTFGYGGGSLGELTMADFIGTPAGYVHNETLPYIIDANNKVMATTDGQTLNQLITQLQTLLTGGYHIQGTKADPATGRPDNPDSIVINGTVFTTLDDAVYYLINLIETQLTVIKNTSDPTIQAALQASEKAHAASCAHLLKENHHLQAFNINLFEAIPNNPINAYVFADGLPYYGTSTGYGQIGDYLERVAADNIYGDAIKGAMRMGRNADALGQLGVNIDRFKLPHSQYFRDPATFYLTAYTGNLPYVPQNLQDVVYPINPADIYIDTRNQKLVESGYNPAEMLPAQADETYYDLQWTNISPAVKENIGLNVVNQAIDRNVLVVGNKCLLTTLNRQQIPFATIDQNGLALTNNEALVDNLLKISNKIIYGQIGATKYENPFNTDQMVYGTLEMLGQVTPMNIKALGNTLLGSAVLPNLLTKINNAFGQIIAASTGQSIAGTGINTGTAVNNGTNTNTSQLNDISQSSLYQNDTGVDRNIQSAWGGSGPDGMYTIPKK
jgi:GH24 family phage-related lysozyme (muramidase)